MANEDRKRYSRSLVVRETQIKTTMRYHYTHPLEEVKQKRLTIPSVRMWRYWNPQPLLVGM